jgi:lipopolysaccharide transport system ATP-binding protein
MSSIAVRVERLSKRYRIGSASPRYRTIRESLVNWVTAPARNFRHLRSLRSFSAADDPTAIWALRDVSFDVGRGEVVGIIGANGAGKSTLLKILSRVTYPTAGRALVAGRVGSLLEVGTGFHPELTGRDNVYLNGAILGMDREYIRRRMDEIVEFAGLAQFMDTPVKRYSTGMYLRLAFSVAAHLEPEVLVVDEVLAVGDAIFQRKCMSKMEDAAADGRTALFVSHNLGLIRTLCTRAIHLESGHLYGDGTPEAMLQSYLARLEQPSDAETEKQGRRTSLGGEWIEDLRLSQDDTDASTGFISGRDMRLEFHLRRSVPGITCTFAFYDELGTKIAVFDSGLHGSEDRHDGGSGVFVCDIPELLLTGGRYRLNVGVFVGHDLVDHWEGARFFMVHPGTVRGRPSDSESIGSCRVALPHTWILPQSPQ